MKIKQEGLNDLEECKHKLNNLLREYNCSLISAEEWSRRVLLIDKDTNETLLAEHR